MFNSVLAVTGKIESISDNDQATTDNGFVKHPKIVVALGLIGNDQLVGDYASYVFDVFLKARSDIDVSVILYSNPSNVIKALQDRNTVGFIFISHTYETDLNSTVLLNSDETPLPNGILSAATPSLRFAAFIGCHGKGIVKHYQAEYEINRLPGKQIVYFTSGSLVTTKDFLSIIESGVKEALSNIADSFKALDLNGGAYPCFGEVGFISIMTRDIVDGLEPRYVYVNNCLVGVIGYAENIDEDTFHEWDSSRNYTFIVPPYIFLLRNGPPEVLIQSAELTPGSIADDYLVDRVKLRNPDIQSNYDIFFTPALHLGDDERPYSLSPETAAPKTMREILQHAEWIDTRAETWPPLNKRFFRYSFSTE